MAQTNLFKVGNTLTWLAICTNNVLRWLCVRVRIMPTQHFYFSRKDWWWCFNIFQFLGQCLLQRFVTAHKIYTCAKSVVLMSFVCFFVTPKQTENRVAGAVTYNDSLHININQYASHTMWNIWYTFSFSSTMAFIHFVRSFFFFLVAPCLRTWLATSVIQIHSCVQARTHTIYE